MHLVVGDAAILTKWVLVCVQTIFPFPWSSLGPVGMGHTWPWSAPWAMRALGHESASARTAFHVLPCSCFTAMFLARRKIVFIFPNITRFIHLLYLHFAKRTEAHRGKIKIYKSWKFSTQQRQQWRATRGHVHDIWENLKVNKWKNKRVVW